MQSTADSSISQVRVSLIDPILTRWIENIKVHRVFKRLSRVRHAGRNGEDLPGVYRNLLAVEGELQRAFKNIGDLFVDVTVHGYDISLLDQDARKHHVLAYHELPSEEWVQLFDFHFLPTDVFQHPLLL